MGWRIKHRIKQTVHPDFALFIHEKKSLENIFLTE